MRNKVLGCVAGTWGYNTEDERVAAAAVPRITLVDLPKFCTKLK